MLLTILTAVFIVSLISFVGALTLCWKSEKLKHFLDTFVSFAAGAMVAAAFLDLLPEAAKDVGLKTVAPYVLVGIVVFFVVERFFYWYHCHNNECKDHKLVRKKAAGYLNLVGDGVHNFMDGVTITAAFLSGTSVGWLATLAVALHEIPQEFGDFNVLIFSGIRPARALFYNFLSALTAIAGVLLTYVFAKTVNTAAPYLLAFGAGGFAYIALADLLPELHHESSVKKGVTQLAMFILGICIIGALIMWVHE